LASWIWEGVYGEGFPIGLGKENLRVGLSHLGILIGAWVGEVLELLQKRVTLL